jgi:predicted ATPase
MANLTSTARIEKLQHNMKRTGLDPDADYNEREIQTAPSFATPKQAYAQRAGRTPQQEEELASYGLIKFPKSFDDAEKSLNIHRSKIAKPKHKFT